MKRAVTIFVMLLAVGCATYKNLGRGDALRTAALREIGSEQVAWLSHNTAALPSGMDSVVTLKNMRAFINDINAANGTVTTTYWYTGTFSTPEGQRDGTLTVQRRLHFSRDDRGTWTPSAPAEEIARNSQWSSGRAAS
ncbi:MAG TPA: hypothetical protein VER58_01195 [Thermoanaerobaculia bacterium]|nr:hypothetical protein [Thermoanaerobaculia bacterium]